MGEETRRLPQRIRVSSKRQITIPAKAYREMGFGEFALIERTDEGLLVKPLNIEEEMPHLDILRKLIDEGYEGEELVERYAAACPRTIHPVDTATHAFSSAASRSVDESTKLPASAETERLQVFDAVERECSKYPAITYGYVFGSFARGDFAAESDVDIRLEYDKTAPFSLFEVAQFQKHLERVTGRSVDVITAKKLKNPNLAAAIEREKVLAYRRRDEAE